MLIFSTNERNADYFDLFTRFWSSTPHQIEFLDLMHVSIRFPYVNFVVIVVSFSVLLGFLILHVLFPQLLQVPWYFFYKRFVHFVNIHHRFYQYFPFLPYICALSQNNYF